RTDCSAVPCSLKNSRASARVSAEALKSHKVNHVIPAKTHFFCPAFLSSAERYPAAQHTTEVRRFAGSSRIWSYSSGLNLSIGHLSTPSRAALVKQFTSTI